jgi:hypothetical protein
MNGVLVIDKPAGPTSHDVVAVVRRAIGSPKVGHTGTLDPLATGVLPLVIGRATRLASYMSGADKEYVARIRFGVATATYDAEGQDVGASAPRGPGCRLGAPGVGDRRGADGIPRRTSRHRHFREEDWRNSGAKLCDSRSRSRCSP